MEKVMLYVGYVAASLFIILGIVMLFTNLLPTVSTLNGIQVKVIFGIVMILYGIYRVSIITIKQRQKNEDSD